MNMNSRAWITGKARVVEHNGEKLLKSYDTIVCKLTADGQFVKMWDGYSATTMRHVDSFRRLNGLNAIGKAGWDKLELEG